MMCVLSVTVMGDGDGMAFENGTGLGRWSAKGEKKGKKEEKEKRESVTDRPHPLEATKKFRGHFFLFWQFLVFVML